MKKRVFSAFLTLIMLLTIVPAGAVTVFAATDVPSGYTKVEYVESYGNGYIDTGWATADATESYAYEITFAPSETKPAASGTIFGAWSNISGVGGRIGMIALRAKGTTRVVFGSVPAADSTTYWTTTTDKQTARVEVDVAANTYEVTSSDVSVQKGTGSISGSSLCEYSAYLFMTNRANTAVSSEATAAKAYGLKCWTDGVLVRDFVPVVENASGVAGLYDLVNGKFHGAAGGIGVYGPEGPAETIVTFTTPSDVTLQVSEGFAVGENEDSSSTPISIMTKTSEVTEGDTTTHTYTLPVGSYRFLSMSKDGPDNNKYYNWDKNFIVTYADVLAGGKTIDADPGLLAGTGWEQKRKQASYYVRQFTDEVLENVEISGVREDVRAKYPHVFTTPSFASTKARHEFTTHEEIRSFLTERDAANAKMYVYELGKGKDNMEVWAAFFTTTDLTGKTWQEAAQAVRNNGKPTVQAQAQVHGDEQSGTEGALALINTLCNDSTWADAALSEVNVVVLPRMNPYGSKIYQYTSAKDGDGSINFNRDYMQLKEVETNMLLALYNELHPEVVIDMHEFRPITQSTSGALPDTKMAVTDSLNLPTGLIDLAYDFVDYETQELIKDGIRLGYYRDGATDTSPVNAKEYYSQRGSIGILFEIPGQRKGKQQWDRRILSQFLGVKHIIDFVAADADNFKASVAAARAEMAEYGKTFDENKQFVTHHVAGDKITFAAPTFNLTDGTVKDANATSSVSKYNKADQSRAIPMGYVIPKSAANIDVVLALAAKHGITYSEIGADETMELRQYKNYYRRNNTVGTAVEEGVELGEATLMRFESGAYFFPVAQESSVVLMLLMEPDIRDASKNEEEWHKSSLVQQAKLSAEDIYRCENIVEHVLTYVPAKPASCETDGNTEHYICACGTGFAANEHKNALEQDSWIIPATGHNFVQQMVGSETQFVCENNCGEANVSLNKVLAACDGVGGTVKVFGNITTASMVVPAGATLNLDGHKLTAENLTVNEGGKIMNGSLSVSSTAIVNLGSNGGYVPMPQADGTYKFFRAEAKTGKDVTYFDNGTKYSFGYKFDVSDAYADAADTDAKIKFGVNISLQAEGLDADYSFSDESVAKMSEVGTGADDFFKVNLNLMGEKVDDVVATPYIKVPTLGFRLEGTKSTDYVPITNVAEFNGVKYTTLEAAIAAAEATGEYQQVYVIDDVTFKRPTTIKLAGLVRLVVDSGNDITISGPVTFDGENKDAQTILFRVMGTNTTLTLNGATFKNYRITGTSDSNKYYGCIARVQDTSVLNVNNVTMTNCSSALCGGFYATGTSTLNVTNSTFTNNTAGSSQYGGAISVYGGATLSVKDSTFTGNSAGVYGGAIGLRNGNATLENVTMGGNSVGATANDVHVKAGSLALKGNVAIERIALESGMTVSINDVLGVTEPIAIDGAEGTVVLVGERVGEYYDKFVSAIPDTVITESGELKSTKTECVAKIGTTEYSTLAAAITAANDLAADSTVTITLVKDASLGAAVTLGGANKITVTLAEGATESRTIAVASGASITTGGNVDFVGGGTGANDPKLVIDGGSTTSTSREMLCAEGAVLTLKNGVVVQNFVSAETGSSPVRAGSMGTLIFDGVTAQNNEAKSGVTYVYSHAIVNFKNTSFLNNLGTGSGSGCVYIAYASSDATFDNCIFKGNTGKGYGSALSLISSSSTLNKLTGVKATCTVKNCQFIDNVCDGALGTVHVRGSSTIVTIMDSTFTGDTGTSQAIYVAAGTVKPTNVTIDGEAYTG